MSRVVAYVPDLMDRSRMAALGDVAFVSEPAAQAARAAAEELRASAWALAA